MKCAKIRALCMMAVLAALPFVSACSSSSTSDGGNSGEPDTTPPAIVAQFPASGATGVTRSGPFWVAFSEPMDRSMFPSGVSFAPGSVYFDLSWKGDTLVIVPSSLLAGGTSHSITIAGAVEDAYGNALGSDFAIPFTTTMDADVTPPTVVGTYPADGATGVLGTLTIEITFSEAMNRGTTQDAISVDPEPADGWAEWEGLTLKLHHSAFPQNSPITITIGVGATDLSGNHLAAPYVFSYRTRTDNTRPYLVSATPANNAVSVPISLSQIVFTFSETMDMNSFHFPDAYIDARVNQLIREEPTTSMDNSRITVTLSRQLLPGCSYWVNFYNATDAAGNPIDPNPTPYRFTTAGTATSYPVGNGYTWHFARPWDDFATRTLSNYNQSTGVFDEVFRNSDGEIQEVVHLKKTSTQIQHLGRDEYRDGNYNSSMIWNDPLPYIKLPVASYLGQTWNFSTTAALNDSMTMSLSGRIEIEASTVDLASDALSGTFKACAVHHLYADFTIYLRGNPVDEGQAHQIMWLAPGVGPAQIVNVYDGGSDTLRVFDWSL